MQWRNDDNRYGLAAVLMHWLVAVAVFGLFGLGLWMTGLTYYDPWYQRAPWWHKGIGVAVVALAGVRLLWRAGSARPAPVPGHAPWERRLAALTHGLLYLLLLAVPVSGYLISTADGRAVDVFGWFAIPATLHDLAGQEDVAGRVHLLLAYALVGLASLHALAALKHHFIDRDRTLLRMLGRPPG